MDEKQLHTLLFWLLAGLTGGSAIATVVTQNIVRAATWLLFALCGTAGVFFLLGADLVGASQLIVYVGGTLVLVIFGVMLTAQGPFISMKTNPAEWALSLVVGLALYGVLAVAALASPLPPGTMKVESTGMSKLRIDPDKTHYSEAIGLGFSGIGVGPAHQDGEHTVRTHYLLPFEIVSVHLLVVLIAAAYLARAKRRRGATA